MDNGQLFSALHSQPKGLMCQALRRFSGADVQGNRHIRSGHKLSQALVHIPVRQGTLGILPENNHICLPYTALHSRIGAGRTDIGKEVKVMAHGAAGIRLREMLLGVCRRIMRREHPAMNGFQSLLGYLRHRIPVLPYRLPAHGKYGKFYLGACFGHRRLHNHLRCFCNLRSDSIPIK